MGRKLVGVLLAVGLVSLGMLVRSLVSSGGDDESADGATIYCVPELAEACRRSAGDAEVVVEDAADTFDRLVVRDAPEAVWVTMAPWPAMVDDERRRSGLSTMFDAASLTDGSAAAGVSPLEWVGWTERLDVLEADCGLTWECVADGDRWADHGGPSSWGRVNLGLEDPSVTTYTLAAVGSASGVFDGARVGTTEVSIRLRNLIDLVGDPTPGAGNAIAQMLLTGPAGIDVTVAPAAIVDERLAGSARAGELDRRAVDPAVSVEVQVVGPGSDQVRTSVSSALTSTGWDAPGTGSDAAVLSGGAAIALWGEVQELMR